MSAAILRAIVSALLRDHIERFSIESAPQDLGDQALWEHRLEDVGFNRCCCK
jgi:hypothetical protein